MLHTRCLLAFYSSESYSYVCPMCGAHDGLYLVYQTHTEAFSICNGCNGEGAGHPFARLISCMCYLVWSTRTACDDVALMATIP
jgi:hypothetical protein